MRKRGSREAIRNLAGRQPFLLLIRDEAYGVLTKSNQRHDRGGNSERTRYGNDFLRREPGIQALAATTPDKGPSPNKYPGQLRDY